MYQRIEFNVADPSVFNSLMLEMQYEDGFVAYLNGKQVAREVRPRCRTFNRTPRASVMMPTRWTPNRST